MPSGLFAGGFSQGLGKQLELNQQADIADKTLALHKSTLDLSAKKNAFDMFKEAQTAYHQQLAETTKAVSEFATNARAQGIDVENDPKAQQYISALAQSFESARQVAQQQGFQGSDPGFVASRFKMAASAGITPEQKGVGETKGKLAGAGEVVKATGAPLDEALRAAGLIKEQSKDSLLQINTKDKILLFDPAKNKVTHEFPVAQKEGMTSTSINTIYRLAAGAHGGTFDQAGNLIALDPNNAASVQAVTDRAAQLLSSGKANDEANAVSMALREIGKDIPELGKTETPAKPPKSTLPPGLPEGTQALPDGTFLLPDGTKVRPKKK